MAVVRRCQTCSRRYNEASSRRFSLARAKCRTDHSIMSKRARATRQQLGFGNNAEDVHLLGVGHGSGLAATAPTGSAAVLAAGAQGPSHDSDFSAHQDDTDGNSSSMDDEEVQPRRKKAAKGSNSAIAAAAAAKGSKQRKGQQGQKKSQQERKGRRIGAKKAKKVYCLDNNDLDKMQDTKIAANMFFGGINIMYSTKELEEYARSKHAGKEFFERHLAMNLQSQQAKKEYRRSFRAKETSAALQAVTQYVEPNKAIEVDQYGETKLPDNVLVHVMVCLAKTRQPGGLRGFACVAKDMANASLASWDFHRAAKAGFAALGEDAKTTPHPPMARGPPLSTGWYSGFLYGGNLQTLPGPSSLGGWEFWEGFLRDPLSPTAVKLKEAMRTVNLSPKGTKAEMALRVLGVFGRKAATSVPVQLLRLVKMEKSRRLAWDGPDASALHTRVNTAIDQFAGVDEDSWKRVKFAREGSGGGVAVVRQAIRERFSSIDEFIEAAQAAAVAADSKRSPPPHETEMTTLAAMATIVMPGAEPAAATAAAASGDDAGL